MQKFKERWEIKANWQLIYPILGILGLLFSGYLISKRLLFFLDENSTFYYVTLITTSVILAYLFLKITLWIFKKLHQKWNVNYRWELIAIFIGFAITGSTAARVSSPILDFLGLNSDNISGWIYWPLRILLIFPVYQILLLGVGWLVGQFQFFWEFEKKMLGRMGFSKFLK
ncbi:DUF6787 family protein [Aquimarina brevivitae]|uniref:DUF6787 domain-containing protein n=1 Tax=Aquimarina brevivitae TaxID=323412 RepID=A0A4Q7P1Q5_9FLAO|nr:DUF6787 family protein [Aquimarina brevivitae]RZS93655.1 hypothetical protein EV197_2235 [Aquimarina brevivitae]